MNIAFSINIESSMSVHSVKKTETSTNYTQRTALIILEIEEFIEIGGVKKRRIYYNVDYTEEE